MENTVKEDIIESDVEVSTLADVSKDKNETEKFLSAESFYEADDIAEHVNDIPKLVRKRAAQIDWTIITY